MVMCLVHEAGASELVQINPSKPAQPSPGSSHHDPSRAVEATPLYLVPPPDWWLAEDCDRMVDVFMEVINISSTG